MTSKKTSSRFFVRIPPVFYLIILFAVCIAVLSVVSYRQESQANIENKKEELSAIARLKVKQIEAWRSERLIDAGFIGRNIFFQRDLIKLNSDPENVLTCSDIRSWLLPMTYGQDYKDILILSDKRKVLLSVVGMDHCSSVQEEANISEAHRSGNVLLSDLYQDKDGKASMDLTIPFFENADDTSSQFLGLVILKIDPYKKLYPLIQTWPSTSRTSESLIIEKTSGGDSLIYLNDLRHKSNTAFRFKYSLNDTAIAGVKALRGKEGVIEAKDYRGEEVIAISNKIPGTNWYMITKTDRSEIMEPLDGIIKWFALFISILFIASVIAVLFISNRKVLRDLKTVNQLLKEKTIADEKFSKVFQSSPNAITITTPTDGKIIDVNESFCTITGYTYDEIHEHTTIDLNLWVNDDDRIFVVDELTKNKKVNTLEFLFRHKTGKLIIGLFSADLIQIQGKTFIISTISDITAKKEAEKAFRDIGQRFYSVLSNFVLGILMVNEEGFVEYANAEYCRQFNLVEKPGQLIGLSSMQILEKVLPAYKNPEAIMKRISDVLSENISLFNEEIELKNGHHYLADFVPIIVDGERQGRLWVHKDISDRIHTEKLLKESETNYRLLVENQSEGLGIVDFNENFVFVNPAGEIIFGVEPGTLTGRNLNEFIPKENIAIVLEETEKRKNGQDSKYDLWINTADGSRRCLSVSASPYFNKEGVFIGTFGVFQDVTQQKNAEDVLKASEDKFRTLFETMAEGVCIHRMIKDKKGKYCDYIIEDANPAFEELTGISVIHAVGSKASELYGVVPPPFINEYGKVASSAESFRFQTYFAPIRKHFDISVFSPRKDWFVTVFLDISEQKKIEEQLLHEKNTAQQYLDVAGVMIVVLDKQGEVVLINKKGNSLLGYEEGELLGVDWFSKVIPPDRAEQTRDVFHQLIKGTIENVEFYENPLISKNGEVRQFAFHNIILKDDKGEIAGTLSSGQDVTEQRVLQKNLEENEEKFRTIFNSANDGYFTMEGELFSDCNKKAQELLGCSYKEIVGKSPADFSPERQENSGLSIDGARKNIAAAMEGKPQVFEWVHKRKDNSTFPAIVSLNRIQVAGKIMLHSIVRDISDQKEAASKILVLNKTLTEKNEELEQVIFVASHDLRSPLVNIQGFSSELSKLNQSMNKKLEDENDLNEIKKHFDTIIKPDINEAIDFIGQSASKMNSLIGSLLKASRLNRTEVNLAPVNINFLLLSVVATFEFQIKNVKAKIDFTKLPDCVGDENLMDQAFSNLLSNALKFTVDGRQPIIRFSGTENESEVIYCVEDNGPGFSDAHAEKIFALFHRLDNDTEGDGLGLAIVKKIAEKHGGRAWVETKRNEGSKFYFSILKQKIV
ncbi:MAG: PAS domain S-box protein [Bacteroidota bacterium]